MQRQIEMEKSMKMAHREFMDKLTDSIDILEKDIVQASEMEQVCTDEWCVHTEQMVDELHKFLYSISEPSWTTDEDSKRLRELRVKLRDLYVHYKGVKS